jgi:hypothetical protein
MKLIDPFMKLNTNTLPNEEETQFNIDARKTSQYSTVEEVTKAINKANLDRKELSTKLAKEYKSLYDLSSLFFNGEATPQESEMARSLCNTILNDKLRPISERFSPSELKIIDESASKLLHAKNLSPEEQSKIREEEAKVNARLSPLNKLFREKQDEICHLESQLDKLKERENAKSSNEISK